MWWVVGCWCFVAGFIHTFAHTNETKKKKKAVLLLTGYIECFLILISCVGVTTVSLCTRKHPQPIRGCFGDKFSALTNFGTSS